MIGFIPVHFVFLEDDGTEGKRLLAYCQSVPRPGDGVNFGGGDSWVKFVGHASKRVEVLGEQQIHFDIVVYLTGHLPEPPVTLKDLAPIFMALAERLQQGDGSAE